jgi:3-dehydroquinate dehydratase / shikimate dehydrogenase
MSKPSVCVTVTAPTTAELRQRRDSVTDADLIELRLDSVSDPNAAGALAGRRTPVIVTCRPVWEGGQFSGSEQERRQILSDALALGAEYVDIEWRADFQDLVSHAGGRRIVLSMHDFSGVPDDLTQRARAMRSTGAEVIKVAVKANRLSDCIPLMELGSTAGKSGGIVLVAMGPRGLASRILAQRFNSSWTYAGALADVGQLTPTTLIEQYRFRTLSDATAVYGLVGSPVTHSVSPAMHNAAFRAARLDAVYLPLDAADVDDFAAFAQAIGLVGASVTIPFKVPFYQRAEEADAVARRIGALNTIRVVNGRWLGGNTDASGFLQPLQERRIPLQGLRVAILGAGGSARAVAIALASSGVDVTVHARKRPQAEEVAMIVSGAAGSWPPEPGSWDLLVNCTPIGMHPNVDETPIARELLTGRLVYDLIYNPTETRLLREAESAGLQTIGGLDMLVAQAHAQFQWWTNIRPPSSVMRTAALKRLSEFSSHEHDVV